MSAARPSSNLEQAFAALRTDLIHDDGPRISTMRNYRFAIMQYPPAREFDVRKYVQRLSADLTAHGWVVLPIDLHHLLAERVRAQGQEWIDSVSAMERRLAQRNRSRALRYLKDRLTPLVEGPDGIAADCARVITKFADEHPERIDRMLALIGRTGALYPYFRSSALLRHLDGRTRNVPVILLYPGERRGPTGLSFMGELDADSDYRPRIYS